MKTPDASGRETLSLLAELARLGWTMTLHCEENRLLFSLSIQREGSRTTTYRRSTLAACIRAAWANEPS